MGENKERELTKTKAFTTKHNKYGFVHSVCVSVSIIALPSIYVPLRHTYLPLTSSIVYASLILSTTYHAVSARNCFWFFTLDLPYHSVRDPHIHVLGPTLRIIYFAGFAFVVNDVLHRKTTPLSAATTPVIIPLCLYYTLSFGVFSDVSLGL